MSYRPSRGPINPTTQPTTQPTITTTQPQRPSNEEFKQIADTFAEDDPKSCYIITCDRNASKYDGRKLLDYGGLRVHRIDQKINLPKVSNDELKQKCFVWVYDSKSNTNIQERTDVLQKKIQDIFAGYNLFVALGRDACTWEIRNAKAWCEFKKVDYGHNILIAIYSPIYYIIIIIHYFYKVVMSTLTSLFEKRSKNNQQTNLSSLFAADQRKKFQKLAEDKNPTNVVYLKPQPKKQQPQNLEATIFVGNIPLNYTRKDLKKLFTEYGKIQKVWFRSVPVEQNKLGRKANLILKKYQEGADSMNGYVKFVDVESAEKAVAANGKTVDEHTLRVSLCLDNNEDYQTTVFVGNLPFDVKEDELRKHFQTIGKVVSVRVVKDKQTHKGIGIGYVRYANKNDMFIALRDMNETMFKQRSLRVKRAVQKSRLEKKVKKVFEKKMNKRGYTPSRQMKNYFNKQQQGGSEEDKSKENARKFHFKRKMIKK